jgi:hypothetical protein
MNEIKRASDLIGNVLKNIEKSEFEQAHSLFSCWSDAAGEKIASHSRIIDVTKGILHIEVDHPGWIQLIQLNRKKIVQFIQKRVPELEINSLAFHLAGVNSRQKNAAQTVTREEMLKSIEARTPQDDFTKHVSAENEKPEMNEELAALFKKLRKTIKEKGLKS